MMRVVYLSHMNVRSPRAHVHNVLKTAESLRDASCEVIVLSTDHAPCDLADILAKHDIRGALSMRFLGAVPFAETQQVSRWKRTLSTIKSLYAFCVYLVKHRAEYEIIYYRYSTYLPVALLAKWVLRKTIIFESHYQYIYPCLAQTFTDYCISTAHGVVAITEALRAVYALSKERSIVAPCHSAETDLVPKELSRVLRDRFGLPINMTLLGYAGSLGATIQGISYEVETLIRILPHLPTHVHSVIVGARSDDSSAITLSLLAETLGVADRVHIFPWCDRFTCLGYLSACDILILPRVGTAPGSSPSKLFDYLAVGRPIVSAHTPAVDEILRNEENALMVNADILEEWVVAVMRVIQEPSVRENLLSGAHQSAQEWTWKKRGERIRDFMQQIVSYGER